MFKKCLKYDLKSVLSVWWIVAVIILSLAPAAAFMINRLVAHLDDTDYFPFEAFGIMFIYIGLIGFVLFSQIIVYIRYYKNFFTDEGYLTFTLPVKRSTLFRSKLTASVIVSLLTFTVLALFVTTVLALIPIEDGTVLSWLFKELLPLLSLSFEDLAWLIMFAVELITILFLSSVLSPLMIFLCITIGGTIVRKHKLLVSIGLIYGFNSIISFFYYPLYFSTIFWTEGFVDVVSGAITLPFTALLMLMVIAFFATAISLLYSICTGILERKLNLA